MILSILATVAVLAAIAVIAAALLLAETVLVYIALGLGAASVLLLLGALVQGRISEGHSERERSGTDGLGKSSVPSAATPLQAQEAAAPREYVESEDIGHVPASFSEPVRETVASDTLTEEDPWSEESEFEVPRWQTPTRGEWPEPVTENTDPLPEPEPPVSAFTTEETPFSYSIPGSPPSGGDREDALTVAEEAVASQSPVGEESLPEEGGRTSASHVTVEAEESPDEGTEAATDAGEPEVVPSSGADDTEVADLDEPAVAVVSGVGRERDVVAEESLVEDAGAVEDGEVPEGAEAAADEVAVERGGVPAQGGDLAGTAEVVADVGEPEAVPSEDVVSVNDGPSGSSDEDAGAIEGAEVADLDEPAEAATDAGEPEVESSGLDEAGVSEEDAGSVEDDDVSEDAESSEPAARDEIAEEGTETFEDADPDEVPEAMESADNDMGPESAVVVEAAEAIDGGEASEGR